MAKDTPVYPPVYLLAALALMILLHWFVPVGQIVPLWGKWLGIGVFLLGTAIGIALSAVFGRRQTTIKPFQRSSVLITDGLYRYSRNPIYLGMALILLGVALFLGSVTPFFVIPLFVALIQQRFIRHEERMLAETFGDDYRAYQRRTRRWI